MSQGFYDLLGVAPDAADDAIHQAYQVRLARLVRRLRSARQSGADVTILEAQERALREAREVLSDPARRRRYDAFRGAVDEGLPASAEALWEQVRVALVPPEVSLALGVVKALTDLPLGQPVPPPPQPVKVHRAVPEPAPVAVPPIQEDRTPDRPTLVPRTDPGIEITLSDAELAWLESPPTPAAVIGPPMIAEVEPELEPSVGPDRDWVDDTWSDTVDTHIPLTDPEHDDDYDDYDDYDEFAEAPEPEEGPSIPGLGFLSRLALPKKPSWAGGTRDTGMDEPSLAPVSADPITRAEQQHGRTGPFLRSVRESRGLSLEELSRSTRISTRYLEAIESDAFDRLPSAIFVQGYLKQVVEQLELDGHGVVEAFMGAYKSRRS